MSKRLNLRVMVLVGMLSALVFALSLLEIRIPLAVADQTRLHLGNVMCLLAGVLFGPLVGGLSAGIGSMVYDLINPLYISEFWITFLTKFAMGFLAGFVAHYLLKNSPAALRYVGAGLCGQGAYIALYLLKTLIMQHFVYGVPLQGAWVVVGTKAVVSSINGIIAVVACVVLAPILQAGLSSSGLLKQMRRGKQA